MRERCVVSSIYSPTLPLALPYQWYSIWSTRCERICLSFRLADSHFFSRVRRFVWYAICTQNSSGFAPKKKECVIVMEVELREILYLIPIMTRVRESIERWKALISRKPKECVVNVSTQQQTLICINRQKLDFANGMDDYHNTRSFFLLQNLLCWFSSLRTIWRFPFCTACAVSLFRFGVWVAFALFFFWRWVRVKIGTCIPNYCVYLPCYIL